MENQTTHGGKQAGLGRRQVLQATAWSVPVIAVAVAAPAVAASPIIGGDALVAVYTFAQDGVVVERDEELKTNVFVSMEGSAIFSVLDNSPSAVTQATMTITVPAAGLSTTLPPTVSGTGWSYGSMSQVGTSMVFTFNFAGTVAPGQASQPLQYTLQGVVPRVPKASVFPKTATGVLTGPFDPITKTVTWS